MKRKATALSEEGNMSSPSATQSAMPQKAESWGCPAELGATRADLFAILGEYNWIHRNAGTDGGLSLRLPRDRAKEAGNVVGEVSCWGGGCDAWAVINGVTPAVDSSGREFWSVDLDEWVYENAVGDENERRPPVKGHMLHATSEKDDDGNLYLVWTMAGENCWMIGKKDWDRRIETEGDRRRLKLTDDFAELDIPTPPQVRRDVYKERQALGLEKLILRNTRLDEEVLLGNYRWIYNSADKRPWHPRESWGTGLALFRNPSGGLKITGRLHFWAHADNAEMRTTVGAVSPSVDEEGNAVWSMISRKWFGDAPQPQGRSFRQKILTKDGHQMRFTVEEDDAGSPFLEVMLCWDQENNFYGAPLTYSYLIGKKHSSRFGRLGFSAEEYLRLAYGRQMSVGIDNRGNIMERHGRTQCSLPNPMKHEE